ncbi:MAG: hypothetical protein HUK09_08765 [Bacteroidaceae bacterium]|nr:hypothetical protein [Bacteroidaceae bacterium]
MSQTTQTDPTLRGFSACGCSCSRQQLNTMDYLSDIPGNNEISDLIEVQFKNTRKGYYRNDNHLDLVKGDIVAVEASPGHDIGTVTLTGSLVPLQMKKAQVKSCEEVKRVYRKARPADLDKWQESRDRENDTMIRSRQIAKDLALDMKIGDVEYQGDGNKAIFYYIADQRVDFRRLIKVLADTFGVKVEMRQIGARQEAGRIGGIGPCGRELCCSTWVKNFQTVSTGAARQQDISPNPQKLAGQCGKLKCCLNYELDAYQEAARALPERNAVLETTDGAFYHFKTDILGGRVTYSTDKRMAANLITISAERAKAVIAMNRAGERPEQLDNEAAPAPKAIIDLAEQDDLTRFDSEKKKKKKKKKKTPQNAERNGESTRESRPQNERRSRDERSRGDRPRGEGRPKA